ncbi:MAG: RimK family alpha-L-glutamate ligase [Phycisphaerales bacterium JB039]
MGLRIGLATCAVLPEPDPDEAPLRAALAAAGATVAMVPWDAPAAQQPDPAGFDAIVLRATWNYHLDPAAFDTWCAHISARTRLLNPLEVVRWNMHKGYLLELERAGAPIVPTEIVARGKGVSVESICARWGWGDIVIKPAISAASYQTRRFAGAGRDAAQAFLDEHLRARDMMIQPYLPSVERDGGEASVMWIAGAVTHVVHKSARFSGADEQVSAGRAPTPEEHALAERIIAAAPFDAADLLYARVDLMRAEDGSLLLSELELIEPSLFFPQHPAAVERLVSVLLGGRSRS